MQNDDQGDLVSVISRCREPWERLAREWEGKAYPGQLDDVHNLVQHFNWLIPLAEVLQRHSVLDSLYPMVHHAVIELNRQPHSVPQTESFMLYADNEGHFELSRHTRDEEQPAYKTVTAGSAEEVTQTLIRLLASCSNDTINREG